MRISERAETTRGAEETYRRRRVGASSVRGNEGESVSRIAIRLKILSGPWILGVGLVGASGKKVFP